MMWSIIQLLFRYFYNRYATALGFEPLADSSSRSIRSSRGSNSTTFNDPYKQRRTISTVAAPGLMTLLDTALYRAHEGQLTSTVSSANAALIAFIQFKSHAQRLLYVCHTMPPPLSLSQFISQWPHCSGTNNTASASSSNNSGNSTSNNYHNNSNAEAGEAYKQRRKTHLKNLALLTSFASCCIECANDAIDRLTTDKLSKSANCEPITLLQRQKENNKINIGTATTTTTTTAVATTNNEDIVDSHHDTGVSVVSSSSQGILPSSPLKSSSTLMSSNNPSSTSSSSSQTKRKLVEEGIAASKYNSWNEIGLRCSRSVNSQSNGSLSSICNGKKKKNHNSNENQTNNIPYHQNFNHKDCWESEALYCPDYVWADDAMLHCQRMVRSIMKHDAIEYIIDVLNLKMSASSDQLQLFFLPLLALQLNHRGFHEHTRTYENLIILLSNMMTLLKNDLPLRLHQFRCGIESDTCVTKRLYLLKNECRAPFRAFLEGHDHLQRVPDMSLVNTYIELHDEAGKSGDNVDIMDGNKANQSCSEKSDGRIITTLKEKKKVAEKKIQDCINDHKFQQALKLEYKCEMLEIDMGMLLLPFCNLARVLLDGKALFHLVEVGDILSMEKVVPLQELLRRLKAILCKKPGVDSSTGIRPILLDLEGIPRDPSPSSLEIYIFGEYDMKKHTQEEAIDKRLDIFCTQLHCLQDLCKSKSGFGIDRKEFEGLTSAMKACSSSDIDVDSFKTKFKDWYSLCLQQHDQATTESSLSNSSKERNSDVEKKSSDDNNNNNNSSSSSSSSSESNNDDGQPSLHELAEKMRKAEIEKSIAMASRQALSLVQHRIDQIEKDRMKRFEILQDMLEEVCLREMDFYLKLSVPKKDAQLELPHIKSVSGIFDTVLEMNGCIGM